MSKWRQTAVCRHAVNGGLGRTSKRTGGRGVLRPVSVASSNDRTTAQWAGRRLGRAQARLSGVISLTCDCWWGIARVAGRRWRRGTTVRRTPPDARWASLLHSRQSRIRQSKTSQSNSHTARWSGTSCTRPPNHPTIIPNNFPLAISSPSILRYGKGYE